MSYTSSNPEYLNREQESSSSASASTPQLETTASQQSSKKKKPWSKFKSGIKTIGDKMSTKPKFSDPMESSEQKKVKKGKKLKPSSSSVDLKPSTPETPRPKSPTKSLMKKLSVDTLSTPYVGYQPAYVSPSKSYARALYRSGSTSESSLSTTDLDTPKKSLTLDRNIKLAQESPDSGRASQTMGSLEGSRPPSSIREVASDLSVDSDYTSHRHGGLEEKVLGDLVTKTEQFAQSLVSPKSKEQDSEVTVAFLKAETVVKPSPRESPKVDVPKIPEQEKPQSKIETSSQNVKNVKIEKEAELFEKPKAVEGDGVDGRKKKGNEGGSTSESTSSSLIASEKSIAAPNKPVSSDFKQSQPKDPTISKLTEVKPEKGMEKDNSENKKDKGADSNVEIETKPIPTTRERKGRTDKLEKADSKQTLDTGTQEKTDKTPADTKLTLDTEKKEDKIEDLKPTTPTRSEPPNLTSTPEKKGGIIEAEKVDLQSKAQNKSDPLKPTSPLTDVGPAAPQTALSVEEKLQAFLAAEGLAGTVNDAPVKASSNGSQQPDKRECLYKILVIGELGTGKTSIIKRYVHQFFSQHYRATIGVDFALKVLNWDSNTIIRLQLWDIAGQERFGNMTRVYYKEAVGAFIVFDVTRSATFDAVLKWKQDLDSKVQLPDGSHIPCVLLANKCDQQKEGIVNTPAKLDEYCKENNFSAWFETSAKENINIDEAAKSLVTQILQNDKASLNGRDSTREGGKFPLDGKSDQEKKSCVC